MIFPSNIRTAARAEQLWWYLELLLNTFWLPLGVLAFSARKILLHTADFANLFMDIGQGAEQSPTHQKFGFVHWST